MSVTLADAPAAGKLACEGRGPIPAIPARLGLAPLLVVPAAFALYWISALIVEERGEQNLFGADTVLYVELAKDNVIERLGSYYPFDRITRFHPMTTALAVAWMKLLRPLTLWITAQQLLKGMFAAVGAAGVWAAMWAFAAVVPRRQAVLWGAIYATSLSIWYFSSIEESKIVAATLSALYIAVYLHKRTRWTPGGAALLTAILLLACLNEIIAGFLVAIPVVDTLVTRGWDLRRGRWIALHALTVPAVLLFLELVINRYVVGPTTAGPGSELEGASHLKMLIYYITQNDFSPATFYAFLVNWFFFSVAAPGFTTLAPVAWPEFTGYFEPALANYLASPVSAGLIAVFGVIAAASLLPKRHAASVSGLAGVVLALLAYAFLRALFWLIINPFECVLFSPPATLAHLLLVAIPFAASRLPAKQSILAACVLLLFITNGTFIIGR